MTERVAMARRLRLGLTVAGMALLLVRVMPAAVAQDPLPTAGTGRPDASPAEETGRPTVEFEVGPAVRDDAGALVHAAAGSDATQGLRFRTALPDGRLSLAGVGGGGFGPAPKLGERRDVAFDLDARLLAEPFGEVTATGRYRNRYRAKTRRLGDTETEFGGRNDLTGLGLRLDLLDGRLRCASEVAWSPVDRRGRAGAVERDPEGGVARPPRPPWPGRAPPSRYRAAAERAGGARPVRPLQPDRHAVLRRRRGPAGRPGDGAPRRPAAGRALAAQPRQRGVRRQRGPRPERAGGAERRLVRRAELRLNLGGGGGGDRPPAALVPDRLEVRGELHETMPFDDAGGRGRRAGRRGAGGARRGGRCGPGAQGDPGLGRARRRRQHVRRLQPPPPRGPDVVQPVPARRRGGAEVGRQLRGDGWALRAVLALQQGTGDGDLLHGVRLKGALHLAPERGPGLESELKLIHRRDEGGGRRDWLQLTAVVDLTPLLPLPGQADGDDGPHAARPFLESYVKLEMGENRSAGESESWLDRGTLLIAGGWRF